MVLQVVSQAVRLPVQEEAGQGIQPKVLVVAGAEEMGEIILITQQTVGLIWGLVGVDVEIILRQAMAVLVL